MAYVWLLLSVWSVDVLALVSPGPNFIIVTQTAMQRSRKLALIVALGIASGSAAWGLAVAVGLATVFVAIPWLHGILRAFGAAYLIYLGLRLWISARDAVVGEAPSFHCSPPRAYLRGLLTNILNPKSAAYYGSVFAMFFPPGIPPWVQGAAIASISITSALWYCAVAVLFSNSRMQRAYAGARGHINRVAGTNHGGVWDAASPRPRLGLPTRRTAPAGPAARPAPRRPASRGGRG